MGVVYIYEPSLSSHALLRRPGAVLAHLMLDSNVGNTTAVASWPDPASPSFRPEDVIAADCTLDDYLRSRATFARMFDPEVKNAEGLDRRNIRTLVPDPASPKLEGVMERDRG